MSPAAILLAAGASRRLGRCKQLLELEGEPMVRRAARLCLDAGFAPVVVVLGCAAAEVGAALEGLPVQAVENPDWTEGMASSLRRGVAALPGPVGGALVLACDQPALTVELLQEFRRRHQAEPTATLASDYGNGHGIPALFPGDRLPELAALRGDRGARGLLGAALRIPFAEGAFDFDTPEDVRAWGLRR